MLFSKMSIPGIAEFYAGKNILITGSTGFMGKVLVEKLLRSCPDLAQLYILIRSKKGKTPKERWDELTKLELFDLLKEQRPLALSTKITVLDGDVSEDQLGLSNQDYKLLIDKISIIFHVAASVRFNEPLNEAVKLNTCSTKQMVDLALQIKQFKVFVHVSTAYSNVQCGKHIEEKVYPSDYDWREVIRVAEKTDPIELACLTSKYLGKLPNTYILSKSLAEQIVWEARDKLPLVLMRPTIVISSWKDPIAGWLDNFNGPVGMLYGCGIGVIRTCIADANVLADFMAVDVAIKAFITAAWRRGTINENCDNSKFIFNCASTYKNISNRQVMEFGLAEVYKTPLEGAIWYPKVAIHSNKTIFRIEAVFKHFLPALFIDALLKIAGSKLRLLKILIKFQVALLTLSYFLTQGWNFTNDNFRNLLNVIPKDDKDDFDFYFDNVDPEEFFQKSVLPGGRKYLLREKGGNEENNRKKYYRFKWLHYTILTLFYFGCAWILNKWLKFI